MTPNRLALIRTLAVACLLIFGGLTTAPTVSASETSIGSNAEALSAFAGFSNPCLTIPSIGVDNNLGLDGPCTGKWWRVGISSAACLASGTAVGGVYRGWKILRAVSKGLGLRGAILAAMGVCAYALNEIVDLVECLVTSDTPPQLAQVRAMIAELEAMLADVNQTLGTGDGPGAGEFH